MSLPGWPARLLLAFSLIPRQLSRADAYFPYAERTRPYSAWSAANRGDTNTIGMAGATTALSSSISSSEANPAGFAMESGSLSAQFNNTKIDDPDIQRTGEPIGSSQWGLAVCPPPWGFSFAYYSPITESGATSEVSLREYRLSVARAFFEGHLSLGAGLQILEAYRMLGASTFNSTGWSVTTGALYRLPEHWVLGATVSPAVTIGSSGSGSSPDLPGFDQPLLRPLQIGLGTGWIPNRFFRVGASVTYVGPTDGTALLADQSVATGAHATWVPRVGASYVLMEFNDFKAEGAVGSYYEDSRLSDRGSRLHATASLELNPYFVNLGAGFDLSSNYKNVILSVGLDLVRTLRTFDIIPKDPVPPARTFFPHPLTVSPNGLPDELAQGEKRDFKSPTVKEVGAMIKEIPSNLKKKVSGKSTSVEIRARKKRLKSPKDSEP